MPAPGTRHLAVPGPVPGPITSHITVPTSWTLPTPSSGLGPRPVILRDSMTVSGMCLLSAQARATAASSEESSTARYSSACDYPGKRSKQEAKAATSSQLSSLGAAPCISVSASPLWTVTAAPSTETSLRGCSPPVAPSCCRSHSPVYGGLSSSPRVRSRSVQSASVASPGGGGGESYKGTSRQSRHSRSPSRTSSRGGSASPGGGKCGARSRSPSQSLWTDKECQEEQSSLDFVTVESHLHFLTRLPEASSESPKIRGFMAALEDNDQPAASYKLAIGGASADILANIDDRVSFTLSGMRSRKVSKLLQFQGVHSHKFCRFQGEDITKAKALNCHVRELAGLRTFDNPN